MNRRDCGEGSPTVRLPGLWLRTVPTSPPPGLDCTGWNPDLLEGRERVSCCGMATAEPSSLGLSL